MEAETTTPKPTQEAPITLTLTHDQAVAIAAASIHFQAWASFHPEMAPTLKALDQAYHLILKQPLSDVSKVTLRDMRYHVAGLKDEQPEGGSQHATTRTPA